MKKLLNLFFVVLLSLKEDICTNDYLKQYIIDHIYRCICTLNKYSIIIFYSIVHNDNMPSGADRHAFATELRFHKNQVKVTQ